jgi:hypothetical protein
MADAVTEHGFVTANRLGGSYGHSRVNREQRICFLFAGNTLSSI